MPYASMHVYPCVLDHAAPDVAVRDLFIRPRYSVNALYEGPANSKQTEIREDSCSACLA